MSDADMADSESQHALDGATVAAAAGTPPSTGAAAHPNPLHIRLISDPKMRFVMELEFVEMLASPQYLQFLAQSRYLVDPAFLNYLAYLQYWRRPEYIKYLSHPHCLYFLDLLQINAFRSALLNPAYVTLLHEQQFFHWREFRYNRYTEHEMKREEKKREEERRRVEEEQGRTDEAILVGKQ